MLPPERFFWNCVNNRTDRKKYIFQNAFKTSKKNSNKNTAKDVFCSVITSTQTETLFIPDVFIWYSLQSIRHQILMYDTNVTFCTFFYFGAYVPYLRAMQKRIHCVLRWMWEREMKACHMLPFSSDFIYCYSFCSVLFFSFDRSFWHLQHFWVLVKMFGRHLIYAARRPGRYVCIPPGLCWNPKNRSSHTKMIIWQLLCVIVSLYKISWF